MLQGGLELFFAIDNFLVNLLKNDVFVSDNFFLQLIRPRVESITILCNDNCTQTVFSYF